MISVSIAINCSWADDERKKGPKYSIAAAVKAALGTRAPTGGDRLPTLQAAAYNWSDAAKYQSLNTTINMPAAVLPLDVILGVVLYWLVLGVAALARPSDLRLVSRVL